MSLSLTIAKSANNEVRIQTMRSNRTSIKCADKQSIVELERKHAIAYADMQSARGNSAYQDEDGSWYVRTNERGWEPRSDYVKAQLRSLDIIHEFQQEPKRYARSYLSSVNRITRFTRYARHTILEIGSVVDEVTSSPAMSAFVTLTLPGDTVSAFRELASHSGYVCNRITQLLRRRFPDCLWFYVWELQKRGALHLHMCVIGSEEGESLRAGECISALWKDILRDLSKGEGSQLLARRGNRDCWLPSYWVDDCQSVHKSVAAYISKYVSKGAGSFDSCNKGFKVPAIAYPKRWWGASRQLIALVKIRRVKVRFENLSVETLDSAVRVARSFLEGFSPIVSYGYDFEINLPVCGRSGKSLDSQVDKVHSLAAGHVDIFYFKPDDFAVMQQLLTALFQGIASMQSNMFAMGDVCKAGLMSAMKANVKRFRVRSNGLTNGGIELN